MMSTNSKKTHLIALAATLATMVLLVSTSFTGNAFAHAHLTLTPDIEHVNPITVIVGHTNEPTFGVKPGVHQGIHGLEISIEDANTALPLSGAHLKADKYYFGDFRSFERAMSLSRADQVETNITVSEVFGEPGHYLARQIVQPGIYGYRIYGTIDYFGVAEVPIDVTVFCTTPEGNTSKFNSGDWHGTFGCVNDINDLYFPNEPRPMTSTDSIDNGEIQQVVLAAGGASTSSAGTDVAAHGGMAYVPALQILALAATASIVGFFGFRAVRNRKRDKAF